MAKEGSRMALSQLMRQPHASEWGVRENKARLAAVLKTVSHCGDSRHRGPLAVGQPRPRWE